MSYTNLTGASGNFAQMMEKGFGIVTVMDAKVFKHSVLSITTSSTPEAIQTLLNNSATTSICELKTLKVANVNISGPDKEIKGGKYADTLLKYGKTATIEIQDALGHADAIEALCGGIKQWGTSGSSATSVNALHFGEDFGEELSILGKSFFIDKTTGQQVWVDIIFYRVLPDSIFNLTQDAEGDASVFDMNGSLLIEEVTLPLNESASGTTTHGLFYSILPKA